MPDRVHSPSLVLTYALLSAETADQAIDTMQVADDPALNDGLAEFVLRAGPARPRVKALHRLAAISDDAWRQVALASLGDPMPSVRAAVLEELARPETEASAFHAALAERVGIDSAWTIRRAALELLPRSSEMIFQAADDPHWRVRQALIEILADTSPPRRLEVLRALKERQTASPEPQRIAGVMGLLEYLWSGRTTASPPGVQAACPFWDWDDAVFARRLEAMSLEDRRSQIAWFPPLLTHGDSRVRSCASECLRRYAGPEQIAAVLKLLDEPRWGIADEVHDLLARIDADRALPAAQAVIANVESSPAAMRWARETLTAILPESDWPPELLSANPSADSTLALEYRSHARARSLTPDRAADLIAEPDLESSWHVLAAAARMCRVPLWKLAPERPVVTMTRDGPPPEALAIGPSRLGDLRPLGSTRILVSRLGLSGHYGLPVEGFARGVEAGVNLFFWEPNYDTLTQFARRIDPPTRDRLHFIAGSFEAEPARVRKDVERALRNLRLETLSLFIIFWVRSQERIEDDLRTLLDQLQAAGKIRAPGLSTHDRAFAVQAIEEGWNPVMTRHSAVHAKAEQEVFPRAAARGTSIITFSSTCYGRLARAIQPAGLTAADCYRYSLAQPSVTTCLTAPATLEQLAENLPALTAPELGDQRRETIRRIGAELYERETLFRKLVRDR